MDFYNMIPSYAASVYQIYRFARINAVHLHAEMVSTGTAPMLIAASVLPYVQATSTLVDPHQLASRPRAISKTSGSGTGMSRVVLNKTYSTSEELGQLNYSDTAWQSYSEATSVTPAPDNPFIVVSVDSLASGDTWAATVTYKLTYHMQFFELQDVSLTTKPNPKLNGKSQPYVPVNRRAPPTIKDEEESMDDFVEPKVYAGVNRRVY